LSRRRAPRGAAAALSSLLVVSWASPVAAGELLVFAAASLADALQELGPPWERETGTRVSFSFAASSTLARQIAAGAPADVFFSADLRQLASLERQGRLRPSERREALSNALVVIRPRDSGPLAALGGLVALPRLALADPEAVPAGVYARELLESRGLWSVVSGSVVPLSDVRAVVAAVAAGHVPAGIVYATDARRDGRVQVALRIPRGEGPEIRYGLAPVVGSRSPELAARLVDFLAGPQSRGTWLRHGFVPLD
jgi:molybdate transport system substrate-binding protein